MAVIIGSVTARDTEFDNPTLNLAGTWGVQTLSIGSRTSVYGAGQGDDGISGFELGADGSLTNVINVKDTGNPAYEFEIATNLASARVGDVTYLYVTGTLDNGLSAFRVEANGALTNVDNKTDAGLLELQEPRGRMATTAVGGSSFLIASGHFDSGFSVFRIEAGGALTNTANVDDASNPLYELLAPYGRRHSHRKRPYLHLRGRRQRRRRQRFRARRQRQRHLPQQRR